MEIATQRPSHYISRLRLTHFRNYPSLALDPDHRHVVFAGSNGAGKTNILEALSLMAPGRGLRRATYEQMLELGAEGGWAVALSVETELGPVDLGTGWAEDTSGKAGANGRGAASRQARVHRAKAPSIDALLEHIRLTWLTPSMDGLFMNAASERRRFIDRLTLSIDPVHNRQLNAYEKAMRQRNKLLDADRIDPYLCDAIEAQMALYGAAIICARQDCLAHMRRALEVQDNTQDNGPISTFPRSYIRLSNPSQALQPFYDVAPDGDAKFTQLAELEDVLIDQFKLQRDLDKASGRALVGPHRTDFEVFHAQKSMPAHLCSTGEQKGLLMRLVFAHAGLVKKLTGLAPILLLDEVGAHLDPKRREAVFELLDDMKVQAFMTGTDQSLFDGLGSRAQYFQIDDGEIRAL